MNRMLYAVLVSIISLCSCSKSTGSTNPTSSLYNGQWRWLGTLSGPFRTVPLVDSPVILSFKPGNLYNVTLNGQVSLQGEFSTDIGTYQSTVTFNNINQPAGGITSQTTGNITYLYFNYAQVDRFILYQNNSININDDTLTMIRTPITPETPVSTFVRVGD